MFKPTDIKPNEEGILGMVMYRKLALPLVDLFIRLGVSPNFITTLTLFVAVLTFYLLLRHLFIPAALVWQLVIIMDVCDGMVARRNCKTSSFGALYDYLIDRITFCLLLVSMGYILGYPFGWWLSLCAILLLYFNDILHLKGGKDVVKDSYSPINDENVIQESRPIWRRIIRWFIGNFIIFHIHIWGYIGLSLFFGINGIEFAMYIIIAILFINVVLKFRYEFKSSK